MRTIVNFYIFNTETCGFDLAGKREGVPEGWALLSGHQADHQTPAQVSDHLCAVVVVFFNL